MATLISSPATVSVTSFPYSLPTSPGQVVFIGTNFLHDIRPAPFSAYDWDYATMGYYGGGVFVEDYSQGGAWVVAGSGGHGTPPNIGACIFDFQDATWKRKDNANGIAWRRDDYLRSEVYSAFNHPQEGELIAAFGNMPCPGHLYATAKPLPTARGGGPLGSVLHLLTHYQTLGGSSGPLTHTWFSSTFNMQTGLWSRKSVNRVLDAGSAWGTEYFSSAYDPVANRYYLIRRFQGGSFLDYLDGNDWTWKRHNIVFPSVGNGFSQSSFVDAPRRLLVVGVDSFLVGLNLNNVGAGWQQLSVSGSLPDSQSQFTFYPPDGNWYAKHDNGGNQIFRLTPPPANPNPFAGTWIVSNVTLNTSLPFPHNDWLSGGSRAHNRFFYVPSIQRLAWITGNGSRVALIKPS